MFTFCSDYGGPRCRQWRKWPKTPEADRQKCGNFLNGDATSCGICKNETTNHSNTNPVCENFARAVPPTLRPQNNETAASVFGLLQGVLSDSGLVVSAWESPLLPHLSICCVSENNSNKDPTEHWTLVSMATLLWSAFSSCCACWPIQRNDTDVHLTLLLF